MNLKLLEIIQVLYRYFSRGAGRRFANDVLVSHQRFAAVQIAGPPRGPGSPSASPYTAVDRHNMDTEAIAFARLSTRLSNTVKAVLAANQKLPPDNRRRAVNHSLVIPTPR
jgi:hypothetical protein